MDAHSQISSDPPISMPEAPHGVCRWSLLEHNTPARSMGMGIRPIVILARDGTHDLLLYLGRASSQHRNHTLVSACWTPFRAGCPGRRHNKADSMHRAHTSLHLAVAPMVDLGGRLDLQPPCHPMVGPRVAAVTMTKASPQRGDHAQGAAAA
jgi:hypothetical protein